MNRRAFLCQSLFTSIAAGISASHPLLANALDCQAVDMPRTLINTMLHGGADLRFLFMPAPNHPEPLYAALTWNARRSLYSNEYQSYQQMFEDQYLLTKDPLGGPEFGMHRSAGWLQEEFVRGNVAVISNAFCSRSRRHDQSVLNADAGVPDLGILNFDRSGWGGRVVEQLGTGYNSIELADSVSTFNKGSESGDRLSQVVHASDMRNMALALPNDGNPATNRNVIARALQSYYTGRGPELAQARPAQWPYHVFFKHFDALNSFGAAVDQRLQACLAMPESLQALDLNAPAFAQQCRNLFDACQVPDVLGMGVMSMSYGGWDTHDNEAAEIADNLSDLFGVDAGLSTALRAIEDLPYLEIPAREQLVFYVASDFGRQIVANGSAGTDHGRGTYSMLIGSAVHGGVYGEMFPERESSAGPDGLIPLQTPGADIEGLTSTDRILAQAVDWVKPGTSGSVFPDAAMAAQDSSFDVAHLLPGW
jgi:uncharacterized protein (DUF1501 family)